MVLIPVLKRTAMGVATGRQGPENNLTTTVRSVVLALALFAVRMANMIYVPVNISRKKVDERFMVREQ